MAGDDLINLAQQLIAQNYELGTDAFQLSNIKAGVENHNFLIESSQGKNIFRIYNPQHSIRGDRSQQSIALELEFMSKARKTGIPSPAAVHTRQNLQFITFEFEGSQRFAVMLQYLNGESLSSWNGKSVTQLAQVVDRLYTVGKSFTGELGDNNIVSRAFTKFDTLPHANKQLFDLATKLKSQLPQTTAGLSVGLVHGDLKLENLLFEESGKLSGVLDFDDYRQSYLIEEATMALMHNLHSAEQNIIRSGYYKDFVTTLNDPDLTQDLEALPLFLQARFLYDVCKYMEKDQSELVSILWQDEHVRRYILKTL